MTRNSEILFREGVENLKQGNFNKAENCFEELKNIYPTNKDILNNLLIACFQNKKFNKSEKNYKEISITGPAKLVFEGVVEVKI